MMAQIQPRLHYNAMPDGQVKSEDASTQQHQAQYDRNCWALAPAGRAHKSAVHRHRDCPSGERVSYSVGEPFMLRVGAAYGTRAQRQR
jgi:hypothetical protein